MPDRVLYLYGFVRSASASPPAELKGVDEEGVELLPLGAFDAAVSRVSPEGFASGRVEERLRDLEWVTREGEAHERVVTWFVDRAWILPARFLTLYRTRDSLERFAAERRGAILETLERLGGRYEWDVKVSYDAARLRRHLAEVSSAVSDSETHGDSPGRGYLLRRAREEKLGSEMGRAARGLAEELLEELAEVAERSVRVPLPREGGDLPVVLSAALLVEEGQGPELRDRLVRRSRELEEVGVQVAYSGPWAPYRFLDEGESDGGASRP